MDRSPRTGPRPVAIGMVLAALLIGIEGVRIVRGDWPLRVSASAR
jgi:hypothetical protein